MEFYLRKNTIRSYISVFRNASNLIGFKILDQISNCNMQQKHLTPIEHKFCVR